MSVNALHSLGETYSDALVGLERFGRLLDMPSAALRARRVEGLEFPNSAGSGPFGRYALGELVTWAERAGLADRADPVDVRRLGLECAVRQCARANGSEATHRFVGGVALMVAAGWRPGPPGHDKRPLVERVRTDDPPPWKPPLAQAVVDRGFVSDPHPAHDPVVRTATLLWRRRNDGRRPLAIPDESPDAMKVITEIAGLANVLDVDDFAREIDLYVLGILRSRDRQFATSSRMIAATMAAVAEVEPGDIVCDPATGEGSTLIELATRTDTARTQTIGVCGREKEEFAWIVAKIRLGVRGIAHQLAAPGFDSLRKGAFTRTFDVVLCEPAAGRREYRKWFELCRRLLADDGNCVLALDADLLWTRSVLGSWWFTEAEYVDSIVITPQPRTRRRGAPPAILTIRPRMAKELRSVIVTERRRPGGGPPTDRLLAPMDRSQIEAIRSFVLDGRPPSDRDLGLDTTSAVIGATEIADIVVKVLGEPKEVELDRGTELRLQHEARTRSQIESETRDAIDRAAAILATIPLPPSRRGPSWEDPAAIAQASGAVRLLRWLLDPDAESDGVALDPAMRNAVARLSTDEVRRALKRLEQRLAGIETRGRPRAVEHGVPPDRKPPEGSTTSEPAEDVLD